MSIWDSPDLAVGGDFIRFDKIGDTVTGKILVLKLHRWDDGSVAPQLLLDTDEGEKTVTAGQVRLKAALAEARPEEGDTLIVTLTDIEKRQGGKTLKHFDVSVVRAGDPAANNTTTGQPSGNSQQLSAEQVAALKAAGLPGF